MKKKEWRWAVAAVVLLAVAVGLVWMGKSGDEAPGTAATEPVLQTGAADQAPEETAGSAQQPSEPQQTTGEATAETKHQETETSASRETFPGLDLSTENKTLSLPLELGDGILLQTVSSYTGAYLEDGSDAPVTNIYAITLKNTGDKQVEYARVILRTGSGLEYSFELTSLLPGREMMVLEQNRSGYQPGEQLSSAAMGQTAYYQNPLSLHTEVLQIVAGDAKLTVQNISGETFPGGYIYYKYGSDQHLIGGITYRAAVPSLEPGEETNVSAPHYLDDGSTLLMVTYGAP